MLPISLLPIRFESGRGHKINGTKPNRTGNIVEEEKQGEIQKETDKKAAIKGHLRQEETQKIQ